MDTLAYLHLADVYEQPQAAEMVAVPSAQPSATRAGQGTVGLQVVKVLLPLAVMAAMGSTAMPAIAQSTVLQFGDQGADVATVQSDLQRLRYPIVPDGVYGDETEAMVARFQADSGLLVDGRVGPETRAALNRALTPNAVPPTAASPFAPPTASAPTRQILRFGDRGQDVRLLQRRLTAEGYPTPETGVFDQPTYIAVQRFQQSRGLVPDGIVGPNTMASLKLNGTSTSSYVVLIPMDSGAKLADVRRFAPTAIEKRQSRLGPYIQAGSYGTREEADFQAGVLRLRGLDAQVRRF
jgi:peptidoglycan hydrolase-like protein with peptidoglycan-binding domain